MENCIFCKIIDKKIPSKILYEDEVVMVYLDINPMHTGHTLIIPKTHYKDLDDIEEKTLNHIMKIAKKIKLLLEEKLSADGVQLIQNNGNIQEVKHYHLHLIPNYEEEKELDLDKVYEILTK